MGMPHYPFGYALWRWVGYCGREGLIEGLFLATTEDIDALDGKILSLGEALGKHSDVELDFFETDCVKVLDDPVSIAALMHNFRWTYDYEGNCKEAVSGTMTLSGHNPFQYFVWVCDICGKDCDIHNTPNSGDMCLDCANRFEGEMVKDV